MIIYYLLPAVTAFAGGLGLGLIYLTLLQASVRFFLREQRAGLGAVLTIARPLLVGAGLWVAVQFGALELFGALAGFTLIRVLGAQHAKASSWT